MRCESKAPFDVPFGPFCSVSGSCCWPWSLPRPSRSPRLAIRTRNRTKNLPSSTKSGQGTRSTAARLSTTCRSSKVFRRPKEVLGYHIGAPQKLTYYADMLKFYRALAAATPRVKVETIGKSDEGRELVVVWVSSEDNMKSLQQNRDNLAKIADPRGLPEEQIRQLIATTKPELSRDGWPAQRRNRPFGDADGARLPDCHRDISVHHSDPQQRLRVRHPGC